MNPKALLRLAFALLAASTGPATGEPAQPFVEIAIQRLTTGEDRESQLRQLADEHPGHPRLHFELGNLLAQQGRWPEARNAYAKALASGQHHPEVHYNLGVALDHLEQRPAALRHYRVAMQSASTDHHALPFDLLKKRITDLEQGGQ